MRCMIVAASPRVCPGEIVTGWVDMISENFHGRLSCVSGSIGPVAVTSKPVWRSDVPDIRQLWVRVDGPWRRDAGRAETAGNARSYPRSSRKAIFRQIRKNHDDPEIEAIKTAGVEAANAAHQAGPDWSMAKR